MWPFRSFEREYGPEPLAVDPADRPLFGAVFAEALRKLAARPLAYVPIAAVTIVLLDLIVPEAGDHDGVAWVLCFPLCLAGYAATASVVAGRWPHAAWRLFFDRGSMLFSTWAAMLFVLPAYALLLLVLVLLIPDEIPTPLHERLLWYGAFFLAAIRLWPIVVVPFVYRGYLLSGGVGGRQPVWIGPGIRVCFRITGQRGFLVLVTLPFGLLVAAVVALLELSDFTNAARLAGYAIALPVLVQCADGLVDRWRIQTGDPELDR